MAIKISGNTIIDDSRNLTANTITATTFTGNAASVTVPDFLQVLAPINVSPADDATEISFTPTLEVSRFQSTAGSTHANTQFQLSTASDFSSTVLDVFTGANTTLVTSSALSDGTEHFFRARFIDNNGCCSCFSTPTSFTTVPLPTTLGQASFGGFYVGTVTASSTNYYIIMAPNATGCACCQWKTTQSCSSIGNEANDGYNNTYVYMANAAHPAGNWTATRSIGGFSDWYMPAQNEMLTIYATNLAGCIPAGEGFRSTTYWSSTESDADCGKRIEFNLGSTSPTQKTNFEKVRAVRRIAFP